MMAVLTSLLDIFAFTEIRTLKLEETPTKTLSLISLDCFLCMWGDVIL